MWCSVCEGDRGQRVPLHREVSCSVSANVVRVESYLALRLVAGTGSLWLGDRTWFPKQGERDEQLHARAKSVFTKT